MTAAAETARTLSLVFTDLVGSTALKTEKGDRVAGELIARHRAHVERLASDSGGRIVDWAGDGCFLTFEVSSAAVLFSLRLQQAHAADAALPRVRAGVHMGEVTEKAGGNGVAPRVEGLAVDLASRVGSLARPGQILMSSAVFDSVRQRLRGEELGTPIEWRAHGAYELKGIDGSVNICEAGIEGISPLSPPAGSEKAHRAVTPGEEDTLGWRPAIGLNVQRRDHWVLEQQLGEGGFGEVWLAVHAKTKAKRVFKFCFEPERVRGLKREVVLFRLLKETLGNREDIAQILDWDFEHPPYFIESEYTEGGDLQDWSEAKGGLAQIPLATRLELVAQVAVALGAAHSVGVLHKDIKPSNVLIAEPPDKATPRATLTDFGIGLITDRQALLGKGITAVGLTETLVSSSTSTSGAGTRMYMAPELIEGKPATTLSDVYALGVVLYQMVMGDFRHSLAQGWERDIQDPLLVEDIAACVDGNPERRIAGAAELATRLRSLDARRAAIEAEVRARQAATEAEARAHQIAEQARKRRRQFLVISMVGASLTAVVSLFAWREGQRADTQAQLALQEKQARLDAESARREADQARVAAEKLRTEAERGKYVSDIRLADLAISNTNLGLARSRLEQTVPELRSWEWGYLVNKAFPPESSADASAATAGKKLTAEEYWLGAEPQLVATIPAFQGPVFGIEFSPDGSRLVARSGKGELSFWDTSTYTRLDLQFKDVAGGIGLGPHYDPTGTMLAQPNSNDVLIINAATGRTLAKLSGHTDYASDSIFSPDSATVISPGIDFKLIGWDWRSGRQLWSRPLPDFYTMAEGVSRQILRFLPDSNNFIVPEGRTTIAVCDGTTGKTMQTIEIQQPEGFYPIWIAPRADYIVYREPARGVFDLVEFPSGIQRAQWLRQVPPAASSIQSSEDGTLIGVRTQSNGIVLLNVGSAAPVESGAVPAITGIGRQVSQTPFVMSADGRLLAVPEGDGSILVFAPRKKSAGAARPAIAHADTIHVARFAGAENRIVAESLDGVIRLWDPDNGAVLKEIRAPLGVSVLKLSPDNKLAFTFSYDGTYGVWNLETGDRLLTLPVEGAGPNFGGGLRGPLVRISALMFDEDRFSPDSRQLVTASGKMGGAIVWDATTFAERHVLEGHKNFVYRSGFSPDGKQILTQGYQETSVRLWNAESGELRSVLECGAQVVHTTFSPDSSRLIATLLDGRVTLWNAPSGEKLREFKAHESAALTAQFNSAGDRFVTSSSDATAALWDVKTGALQARFTGHSAVVFGALFSPAGDRVLTLGFDGTARIWDLQGNEMLSIQSGETIHFGAWSPKGTRFVLTTQEGHILVYDSVPPAELAAAAPGAPLRDQVLAWREHR
jgi:WD40 repeat protein/class 3 adenylate cyclase/tRNA A-37 threonylcarbamoyl transferase component Bud32